MNKRAEAAATRIVNCLGIEMRDEHHLRAWVRSAGKCIESVYAEVVAEAEVYSGRACKEEQAAGNGPCGACPECYRKRIADLVAENKQLRRFPDELKVTLNIPGEEHPFDYYECKVLDVSHSERSAVIECESAVAIWQEIRRANRELHAENERLRNAHATDEKLLSDIQAVLARAEHELDEASKRITMLESGIDYGSACHEALKDRLVKVEEVARAVVANEVCLCSHDDQTCEIRQLRSALGGEDIR